MRPRVGTRERTDGVVREVVLTDNGRFTPLLIERARGETQLSRKEVKIDGARSNCLPQRSRGGKRSGRPAGDRPQACKTARQG
jgi:hypothetical protein